MRDKNEGACRGGEGETEGKTPSCACLEGRFRCNVLRVEMERVCALDVRVLHIGLITLLNVHPAQPVSVPMPPTRYHIIKDDNLFFFFYSPADGEK